LGLPIDDIIIPRSAPPVAGHSWIFLEKPAVRDTFDKRGVPHAGQNHLLRLCVSLVAGKSFEVWNMSRAFFTSSSIFSPVLALATGLALVPSTARAVTMPMVGVGNLGNAADTTSPSGPFGSVAYQYSIGTTEVTNTQYAEFLNAIAYDDVNSLYAMDMGNSFGGINRSGFIGAFSYAPVLGRENHPVNFVSFWDAARFANWLENGQPFGPQDATTTEDGTYTLTPAGMTNNTVTRNPGKQWAVASADEWYKAAYHQPAGAGGDSDNYWLYPTSSNTISTAQANYDNVVRDLTPVGSYGANFYGTFDMGGNVWEMSEAIIGGSFRSLRGGSWTQSDSEGIFLRADHRDIVFPEYASNNVGFRVTQVPAPGSVALMAIGGLAAARRRR